MDAIIKFNNITIEYKMKHFSIKAVDNVSLDIIRGKITAIVGESGSGKTTLVSAILRNISSPGEIVAGEVKFIGAKNKEQIDIVTLDKEKLNQFRWRKSSMVFQASQSTLNPLMKIGEQFYETAYYHGEKRKYKEYRTYIESLLTRVKLNPTRVIDSYPHELSGGMKQRVMIAFALLLEPEIIILDEPTTALDVITQYYIFDILSEINKEKQITFILLTHDIGVVAKVADYVAVMYAGKLVEYGDVYDVFNCKFHPYTEGLIKATPSLISNLGELKAIGGEPPNLLNLPSGCVFHPRCKYTNDECINIIPEKHIVKNKHYVYCHKYKTNGGE
ncbi:MAG: ABC transporter ATP-binding protein [Acholeplasmataceae bacterium]|jgi:peptide/nickel transport system ATP-binding protein